MNAAYSSPLKGLLLMLANIIVAATAMFVLASAAPAQMPDPNSPAVKAAINSCKGDRDKHCAKVAPGEGRVVRCLMQHADALSPACRTALSNARAASAPR